MTRLPHTKSCFVCGEQNPLGFKLTFETDGKAVTTRFTPKKEHAGFRDTIHGGVIATLCDEMMGWACAVETKQFAYCAELNVRFNKPVRPGREIVARAWVTANRKNRIFETRAELHDVDGVLLAIATGKFIPIPADFLREMVDDFVGDPTPYLQAAERPAV